MESMTFVIFGAEGHRQRESFCDSQKFNTGRGLVRVFNADKTGSNEFSLLEVEAESFDACREELAGQLSDGVFENSRTGRVIEITEGDTLGSNSGLQFEIRQAAAGNWVLDVQDYSGAVDTFNCFDSLGEAVIYALKNGADPEPLAQD